MFPVHENNIFFCLYGLVSIWCEYIYTSSENSSRNLCYYFDYCVCCSVRSQRKCRWSASGLPLHACCSQPVWRRPLFHGQPEVVQLNAVIESVEVAGIQLEETVYLLTASPQSWVTNRPPMFSSAVLAVEVSEEAVWMFLTLRGAFLPFLCLLLSSVLV